MQINSVEAVGKNWWLKIEAGGDENLIINFKWPMLYSHAKALSPEDGCIILFVVVLYL